MSVYYFWQVNCDEMSKIHSNFGSKGCSSYRHYGLKSDAITGGDTNIDKVFK